MYIMVIFMFIFDFIPARIGPLPTSTCKQSRTLAIKIIVLNFPASSFDYIKQIIQKRFKLHQEWDVGTQNTVKV